MLTTALLQLGDPGPGDRLGCGLDACLRAVASGADVVVFPEMWQTGYLPVDRSDTAMSDLCEQAITVDDPWVDAHRQVAADTGTVIVATFLQRWDGAPRNAAVVIDCHGDIALTYAKVHTCDFSREAWFTPGDGFPVASVDTRQGPVRVGVMICYDREFPESARALMVGGAELILTPNACPLDDDRIGQFRARAFENMVAVAMANYAAPKFNGRSCAFDGMYAVATADGEGRSRDHTVVIAGPDEQIVSAAIDIDALRRYRASEAWGDAYRKPHTYTRLASDGEPSEPFQRSDSRRSGGR